MSEPARALACEGSDGGGPSYSFRSSLFGRERMFRLSPDGLVVVGGRREVFANRDIARVWLSQVQHPSCGLIERCRLQVGTKTVVLQSLHVAGVFRFSDRKPQYETFVLALVRRVAAANPGAAIWAGTPGSGRAGWLLVVTLAGLLATGGVALLVGGDWGRALAGGIGADGRRTGCRDAGTGAGAAARTAHGRRVGQLPGPGTVTGHTRNNGSLRCEGACCHHPSLPGA